MQTAWIAIAAATVWAGPAMAQGQTGDGAEMLPETIAEGEEVGAPVTLGTGVDAGASTIKRQDIELRTPGSGDVNQLLKMLPTVQFNRGERAATPGAIQDIRPADISISGGHFYANNISLDGVNINSRLDVTNTNAQNVTELAGPSAQTLWVDSGLVGEITVLDSNVSSEYGGFTGGTLRIDTRDPSRTFGVGANIMHTSNDFTSYQLSQAARDRLGAGAPPAPPEFEKFRYGASVDVPLGDRAAVLVAYNRSESRVFFAAGANYGAPRRFRSLSENVLVKGVFDIDDATKLKGQFLYTPYSSTSSTANAADAVVDSRGGGISAKLALEHSGSIQWKLEGSFSHNDTGRTAPANQYTLPRTLSTSDFCTSTSSCVTGGIGDLDQTQNIYTVKGSIGGDIGAFNLRGGFDYEHITARRNRPEANRAYFNLITTASNVVCVDGNSLDCVTGEYAMASYSYYKPFDAGVTLDTVGAWIEGTLKTGPVTLRGGVRYDYESFLGNHVFAPRLAASYQLPWHELKFSLGANRYYGTGMLAYALREQVPAMETWRRTGVMSGGSQLWSNSNWTLFSVSSGTTYRNSGLRTPYSDELTAALSGRVFGGVARLKGIYRDGKDIFARSPQQTEVVDGVTRRYFAMTNEGASTYRGVSFEWERTFGKHALGISINYSKTKRTNPDYMTEFDEEVLEALPALYQGTVYTTAEIVAMNRDLNFAAPLLISGTWSASWAKDRIRTNVSVYYRNGFDRIEDTEVNQTIDGVRYDVYDLFKYSASVDVNLNIQFDVIKTKYGTLTLDGRIENLLDSVSSERTVSVSNPYQYGRSAWIGASYKF